MKRYLITSFIAVIAISGCETLSKQRADDDAFKPFGVFIAGKRLEDLEFRKDENEQRILQDSTVKNALAASELVLKDTPYAGLDLRNKANRARLRENLSDIYEGNTPKDETSPSLGGMCGFSTIVAIRDLMDVLDRSDRPFRRVEGKIRDYVFRVDERKERPRNRVATGHGHLAVEMRRVKSQRDYALMKKTVLETLHWDIEIKNDPGDPNDGYEVVLRQGSPDNVPPKGEIFPDTITLPDFARDPGDPDSVWKRELNHKLFAKGKSIKVRHVYRKIGDGPLERLDDKHAFYKVTECSCVDIMFKGFPPELKLPSQDGYCLGRCDHPLIVNSR